MRWAARARAVAGEGTGRRPPIGILTLALVALSGAAARPAEAPLPTGETIEVAPGERLGLVDRGAGETVLLLPSLSFPAHGFRHVVPRLVESGHRVLVVDPLGLGRSTQPPGADYSSCAHAGRVARVLEVEAGGPVLVVAPSGGSAAALRLAAARPDLVRAVLALEAGVPEEPMSPGMRRAIRWAPLLKLFGGRRRIRNRLHKTLAERSHDPAWVTQEVVDSYLGYAGADFDGLTRTYRLFADAREKEPLREQLPRVRCPVRLLSGATPHKGRVPEDETQRMRAGLAHLELESVPRCGHFVAEEAPDAVVQAIDALAAADSGAWASK
jgi:pimeloyl-ACP methyl ester carboxylesterase